MQNFRRVVPLGGGERDRPLLALVAPQPGVPRPQRPAPSPRAGRVAHRKFSRAFDTVVTAAGMHIVTTPVQAPRANAIAERFIGSLRRELLDRILILNQGHAAAVLAEYERHFNQHRPHRALGQATPLRPPPDPRPSRDIRICP